jgi:hypothetical protein
MVCQIIFLIKPQVEWKESPVAWLTIIRSRKYQASLQEIPSSHPLNIIECAESFVRFVFAPAGIVEYPSPPATPPSIIEDINQE